MKKTLFTIAYVLSSCLNTFSQATSLTIDCQTPGWLSSMINYGDQISIINLKVTGYINSVDLAFIGSMMDYELDGKIDLSEVTIVKNGKNNQNTFFDNTFGLKDNKHLKCLELPLNLTTINDSWSGNSWSEGQLSTDTLVIGGEVLATINKSQLESSKPVSIIIREGVKYLKNNGYNISLFNQMGTSFSNTKTMELPSSLKTIERQMFVNNTTIQSLSIPDSVETIGEFAFAGTSFLPRIFYLPYALKEFYFSSILKTIPDVLYFSENTTFIDNSEYYDNNSGGSWYSTNTGYRPVLSNEPVEIHIKAKTIPQMKVANKFDNDKSVFKNCVFYVCADLVDQYKNSNFYKNGTIVAEKEIEKLKIDKKQNNYYVGDQFLFSASYEPVDATDIKIKWKSNDKSVITLSEKGEAKCEKYGRVTVTASTSYNRLSEDVEIEVFEHTTGVEIDKNKLVLNVGQSETIKAIVYPIGFSDGQVLWKSSNEEIAIVDSLGKVTGIKPGECVITCITKDREYKEKCYLNVIQPVTGIKLNYNTYQLDGIGDSFKLEATILPDNASNSNIKWSSSDESVCVVSHGQVIAVGTGTCVIIANTEDGDYIATCTVTVTTTDISLARTDKEAIYRIYDINGVKRTQLRRGINIVRFADGTMKKVLFK